MTGLSQQPLVKREESVGQHAFRVREPAAKELFCGCDFIARAPHNAMLASRLSDQSSCFKMQPLPEVLELLGASRPVIWRDAAAVAS